MEDVLWFLRRPAAHGRPETPWTLVRKDDWLAAEAASGFRGGGNSEPATGGFGGNGIEGRYVESAHWRPEGWDWDPKYRDAVNGALAGRRT